VKPAAEYIKTPPSEKPRQSDSRATIHVPQALRQRVQALKAKGINISVSRIACDALTEVLDALEK
jgi:hypothetical protein